ncbi:hypothetical protein D3C81_1617780 [compost metagenome]
MSYAVAISNNGVDLFPFTPFVVRTTEETVPVNVACPVRLGVLPTRAETLTLSILVSVKVIDAFPVESVALELLASNALPVTDQSTVLFVTIFP